MMSNDMSETLKLARRAGMEITFHPDATPLVFHVEGTEAQLEVFRELVLDRAWNQSEQILQSPPSVEEWVGLTEGEVKRFQSVNCVYPGTTRAIETLLKEKNAHPRYQ
jgi:hypothetical protein